MINIGSILNFNFDVPCRASPRCCSQSPPGGWIWIYFFTKLVDKYNRKIHRKSYDDCLIDGGNIYFLTFGGGGLKKKRRKRENEL